MLRRDTRKTFNRTTLGHVMDELTLAVVGIDYPNADRARTNRRSEALMTLPGERVEMRPEPRNRHDEHAVAVWSARGVQIGYLSAERAPWIGRRIKAGEPVVAVFQGMIGSAAAIRVRFGGGDPTLPSPPSHTGISRPTGSGAVADFFPDPDGPDWGA